MSNKTRARRRSITQRLRKEGEDAAVQGRHIETCPYEHMDAYQWKAGYLAKQEELERERSTR